LADILIVSEALVVVVT